MIILILKIVTFILGVLITSISIFGFKLYFSGDLKTISDKNMSLGEIYKFIHNR